MTDFATSGAIEIGVNLFQNWCRFEATAANSTEMATSGRNSEVEFLLLGAKPNVRQSFASGLR